MSNGLSDRSGPPRREYSLCLHRSTPSRRQQAYIYATHDGGKTWVIIVNGIPEGAYVNSVQEDPQDKGLLYAATELRVYVSFDDGARWQPLQCKPHRRKCR
jgi:photosystem II stability/assembly factor-like uncharacterized protein